MADTLKNIKILIINSFQAFKRTIIKTFSSEVLQTKNLINNYANDEKSIIPSFINFERPTPLCYIMKKYGTDKALYQGRGKHNYTTFYYSVFGHLREKSIRLFELGIGSINPSIAANMGRTGTPGASLRGWKEFFISGEIFGADIDKDILFNETGISTFYCDQTDPSVIKEMWDNQQLKNQFDIIIDDGLHEFEPNICFLTNSFHKLKTGGIYIVEDVGNSEIPKWKEFINKSTDEIPQLRFTILPLPNRFIQIDNNLIVIEKIR